MAYQYKSLCQFRMRKSDVVAMQDLEKHENDASITIYHLNDSMAYNYATLQVPSHSILYPHIWAHKVPSCVEPHLFSYKV